MIVSDSFSLVATGNGRALWQWHEIRNVKFARSYLKMLITEEYGTKCSLSIPDRVTIIVEMLFIFEYYT